MTPTQRLNEIAGRLEAGMKGDYRINRLDMQTHADITWLLEEVRVLREALGRISEYWNGNDASAVDAADNTRFIAQSALERNEDNE